MSGAKFCAITQIGSSKMDRQDAIIRRNVVTEDRRVFSGRELLPTLRFIADAKGVELSEVVTALAAGHVWRVGQY